MSLKEKHVSVNDTRYIVRELTIGQMLPLMERLSGDDAQKAQMEMVSLSVHDENDSALRDRAELLGVSAYMELTKHVMEVNGLGDSGNE